MIKRIMDNKQPKIPFPLASIPPGTKCRLVGIQTQFPRNHRHGRGHHRRHAGRFSTGKIASPPHGHVGRGLGVLTRLLDLGLTKGCVFEVIHASSKGPVLIEIRGTRIALGHGLASKILVEEVLS